MGNAMTPDSYCPRCDAREYRDDPCHCPTTCALCREEIKRKDKHGKGRCVPSDAEQRAIEQTEQAFWDACVVALIEHSFGPRGSGDSWQDEARSVKFAASTADALVEQRRKRIAARAKGG